MSTGDTRSFINSTLMKKDISLFISSLEVGSLYYNENKKVKN